jgi:NDP-sugar pyrophosphorylase family protein
MNPPNHSSFPIAILGAGLGSRMQSEAKSKPLAKFLGTNLLHSLLQKLLKTRGNPIICALRAEHLSQEDRNSLPDSASYLFVNTESSLHTLVELIRALPDRTNPALFLMADTILKTSDLLAFAKFCGQLPKSECAILTTHYVDDEKPLWVHKNAQNNIIDFNSTPSSEVTSGIYWLNSEAMDIAEEVLASGTHRMRNFLSKMAHNKMPIKSFVVSKTLDVDHPLDLKKAEEFLQNDE